VSGQDLVEIIERQVDAMIGNAALGEVVGPDALRPVSGTDLRFPGLGTLARRLTAFEFIDARPENVHRQTPVLMLGLFRRNDDDARRQMRHANRAVGLVDVLATGAAGS